MKHLGGLSIAALLAVCTSNALGATTLGSNPGILSPEDAGQFDVKSKGGDSLGPEIRDGDESDEPSSQMPEQQEDEKPTSDEKPETETEEKRAPVLPPPMSIAPPAQEFEIKKTEPAGGVVRRPLLRSKTIPEIGLIQKPKVADVFREHFLHFQKDLSTDPEFPNEMCADVVEELTTHQNTIGAYLPMKLFLNYLNSNLLVSNSERVNADKEAEVALRHAKQYMVNSSGDSMSSDLVDFMPRLIRCKLAPLEDGRGFYQMMIRLGYTKALQSLFAWLLARGENGYDPALVLDAYGNTLLHLAVMSEAYDVPDVVLNMEHKKNFGHEDRRRNGVYWVLTALELENDDGMKPFQLAKDGNMVRKLKEIFRNNANFLKFMAREGGVPLDLSDLSEIQQKIDAELDAQEAAVGA